MCVKYDRKWSSFAFRQDNWTCVGIFWVFVALISEDNVSPGNVFTTFRANLKILFFFLGHRHARFRQRKEPFSHFYHSKIFFRAIDSPFKANIEGVLRSKTSYDDRFPPCTGELWSNFHHQGLFTLQLIILTWFFFCISLLSKWENLCRDSIPLPRPSLASIWPLSHHCG